MMQLTPEATSLVDVTHQLASIFAIFWVLKTFKAQNITYSDKTYGFVFNGQDSKSYKGSERKLEQDVPTIILIVRKKKFRTM